MAFDDIRKVSEELEKIAGNPAKKKDSRPDSSHENGYSEDGSSEGGYSEDGASESGYSGDGYPGGRYSDEGYSGGRYSGRRYVEEEYSEEDYPEDEYSEDEYPEEDYPEDEYSEEDYPEDEYPEEDYPENEYSEEDYPEDEYSEEDYPESEYSEDDYPEYDGSPDGRKVRKGPGKKTGKGKEKLHHDSSKSRSKHVVRTKDGKAARKARQAQKAARQAAEAAAMAVPGKKSGFLSQAEGLWAAFCVPVVIMIVIFVQRGIFPFGEETFLRTDMYHQYAPFFSEFQHKLSQGGSLLYSWDIGMGVNFSALYAYYLASPVNWLLILCPKAYVIEFMTYSIVLKIGLAGLSFAWYLKKHFNRKDFGVAFFGIFYALSGYMAAYSWNIMWLDCILLFPLVMLGLEKLVREKKGLLYSVTLGLCILSNYYISIMICIFMVIYFAALLIMEWKKEKRPGQYLVNIGQFAFYSLAAGGLAAAVLLPEIYALQMTASGDFNFPQSFSSYFSIFDMFARHIGNVEIEIGLDHWPNIFCGVAVIMFLPLYLICGKISPRQKAVYCGLLLLFYASFSINVLNFIWHGFHYPNSLPCRQSFIYICLVLTMCYEAYSHLGEMEWKQIAAAFAGAVGFVLLAEKLVEQEHFSFYVYYIAIIFLAIYAGLIYLYRQKGKNYSKVMLLALAVVAVEAAVNTTITSVTTTSRTSYIRDNEDVRILTDSLSRDEDFFRVEKITRKTKNDGAWMNFPSVSLFSSTANADLTAFFKELGCEGSVNAYSITGSTPLVDSLFSVKYALYSEEQWESDMIGLLQWSGDTYLYQRYYTLPLGFMLPSDFGSRWMRDLGNPALVQNNFCDAVGAEQVLVDVGGENNGDSFTFVPRESGEYYVYIGNRQVEKAQVRINEETRKFDNVNRGFFLELGWCDAGVPVDIYNEQEGEQLNAMAYLFNNRGLKEVYEILNQYPLQVAVWEDDAIEGVVNTSKSGTLFTSIPYDKGWTVTVDGQIVQPEKMFDAFIGIPVSEGLHTIGMSYVPQGLKLGIYITLGSIGLLLVTTFIGWLMHRKREMHQFMERNDTRGNDGQKDRKVEEQAPNA